MKHLFEQESSLGGINPVGGIDPVSRIDIVLCMVFEFAFQVLRIEKIEEHRPWNAFVVHKKPREHCPVDFVKRPSAGDHPYLHYSTFFGQMHYLYLILIMQQRQRL